MVHSAPKDGSSDGSVLFASFLILAILHVLSSGLDVFVDLDTVVDDLFLSINNQLLRVEEGLTHFLESLSILGANLRAVLHADANFLDEETKFVDAVSDLAEGAVFEVLDGLGHVSDERVDILDACVEVFDMLNLKCSNKESVDKLCNFEGSSRYLEKTWSFSFAVIWVWTNCSNFMTASRNWVFFDLSENLLFFANTWIWTRHSHLMTTRRNILIVGGGLSRYIAKTWCSCSWYFAVI